MANMRPYDVAISDAIQKNVMSSRYTCFREGKTWYRSDLITR